MCRIDKLQITFLNQAFSVNYPIYQLPGVQPAQIPPSYQQAPPIGIQQVGYQGNPYGNQQAGFIGYQPLLQQGGIQGFPIGTQQGGIQNYPIGTQQAVYPGVQPGWNQGIPIGSLQGAQPINPQIPQFGNGPVPGPIIFPR